MQLVNFLRKLTYIRNVNHIRNNQNQYSIKDAQQRYIRNISKISLAKLFSTQYSCHFHSYVQYISAYRQIYNQRIQKHVHLNIFAATTTTHVYIN